VLVFKQKMTLFFVGGFALFAGLVLLFVGFTGTPMRANITPDGVFAESETTYTVSAVTTSDGASLPSTGTTTVTHGGSYSFTIQLQTGYTNSANPTVTVAPTGVSGTITTSKTGNNITYTIPNITGNITSITIGNATINSYTLTYNGGTNSSGGTQFTASHNHTSSTLTLSTDYRFTRVGYRQTAWTETAAGTGTSITTLPNFTAAKTIYPFWTARTVRVTYNGNNGLFSGATTRTQDYTYDGRITTDPTEPTRAGYNFKGWARSADGTNAWTIGSSGTTLTVANGVTDGTGTNNATLTLFAQWEAIPYTVGRPANGTGYTLSQTQTSRTIGQTYNISFTSSTGYTSSGPTLVLTGTHGSATIGDRTGSSPTWTWTVTVGSANIAANNFTLTPNITENNYNISVTLTSGHATLTSGATGATSTAFTATRQYTISPATGYTFNGWTIPTSLRFSTTQNGTYTNGSGVANQSTATTIWVGINQSSPAAGTLVANTEPKVLTVTYNANGGTGTMGNSSHVYNTANNLSSNTFTRAGYTFSGWNTNAAGTGTAYSNTAAVTNTMKQNGGELPLPLFAQWTANAIDWNYPTTRTVLDTATYNTATTRQLATASIPAGSGTAGTISTYAIAPTIAGVTIDNSGLISIANTTAIGTYDFTVTVTGNNTLTMSRDFKLMVVPAAPTGAFTATLGDTFATQGTVTFVGSATNTTQAGIALTLEYSLNGSTWFDTLTSSLTVSSNSQHTFYRRYKEGADFNAGLSQTVTYTGRTVTYNNLFDADTTNPTRILSENITAITLTNPTQRTGYTFTGWKSGSLAGDPITEISTGTHASNLSIWASWIANTLTVTYNANNGTGDMENSIHTYGIASNLTANGFARIGYTFLNWNTASDGTGTTYINNYAIPDTMKLTTTTLPLYAIWSEHSYTINGEVIKYSDAPRTFTATPPTGHSFTHWTINHTTGLSISDLEDPILTIGIHQATPPANGATFTVTATYEINKYRITFNLNGGNGTIADIYEDYYTDISTRRPTNPIKTGHIFEDWYTDDGTFLNKFVFDRIPANDITIFAKWQVGNFAIVFNSNQGTAVPQIVGDFGTPITTPANPTRTGFVFDGWYTDNGVWSNPYTIPSTMPEGGAILFAKWNAQVLTVIYNANGGEGDMDDSNHVYDVQSNLAPNMFTRTGWTFIGWSTTPGTQSVVYSNTIPVTMPMKQNGGDLPLYAQWRINPYTITFVLNGGYWQREDHTTESFESVIVRPEDPSLFGHNFVGWYISNISETEFEFPYILVGNVSVYARFAPMLFTVTFDSKGGSEIQSYTGGFGTTFFLETPEKDGYIFTGWFIDEGLVMRYTENTVPFGDTTLYAGWRLPTTWDNNNGNGGGNDSGNNIGVVLGVVGGVLVAIAIGVGVFIHLKKRKENANIEPEPESQNSARKPHTTTQNPALEVEAESKKPTTRKPKTSN